MTKTNIVLGAAAVIFGAGCFVLFKDIGAQRDRVRALEAQVAQLHREMKVETTTSQSVTSDTAIPTGEPPAQAASIRSGRFSTSPVLESPSFTIGRHSCRSFPAPRPPR